MKKSENIYRIGQKLKIEIEKIVFGGEGLGRKDGFTIFVPMSVPGDILEIEIISVKKSYGRGLITKIIKPSEDRIEDISKISFEDFDGCDFGMLKYEKQLEYKNNMLREVLEKIGGINIGKIEIENIIGSDIKTNYRNKTAEPLFKKDGKILTGFYSKKSHNIFSAKESLLKSYIAEEIINKFLNEINVYSGTKNEFKVYNETTNTGFLKHIIVRNNEKNEVMIIIVVSKKSQFKQLIKVLEKLYNENEFLKSIYISVKREQNNVILGEETRHLFGNEYLEEEVENIKFKIYPDSFFQINKSQAVKLYEKGIEYLGESKNKTVIDAFSGTGTIAMALSPKVKKAIGIESVESSVVSANQTANENNIKNAEFINGKVEKILPEILKKEKGNVDAIIFDPPRRGIEEKALKSVIRNKIPKIIYISCNPSTFSRDIKLLLENGYKFLKLCPVDMFPQTAHIEIVGLLENRIFKGIEEFKN
ncbi:23S rRNA (uracil(1939)-C(5))-methyltransferase RlmD [Leptotrichia sp. OH3620_COT-345]|uniref:23S rRNA (uracil(1939)-C(5))-methyltransferase RlmD n=1 Tax=Leptotrichia sp. OH3620_COT-345 TaxID=2491048 RepID=UPI000F6483A4|nr:23S rRNA (uracil(1939)-C(5))-methyltransferase RlmD [Leptotrichia sp. OH3620_COT-345]RRD41068.1 23S rRNA (uracil(1939)-C(5))-methyltransferase RlmD [Leptotrichia sp. OH3620_COT-345]